MPFRKQSSLNLISLWLPDSLIWVFLKTKEVTLKSFTGFANTALGDLRFRSSFLISPQDSGLTETVQEERHGSLIGAGHGISSLGLPYRRGCMVG